VIEELLIGPAAHTLGLFVKGMGQDAHGDVYVLASTGLGPYGDTGSVLKIVPAQTTFSAHIHTASAPGGEIRGTLK